MTGSNHVFSSSAHSGDVESRIDELFTMARLCHWSHSEILEHLQTRVYAPLAMRAPNGRRKHSQWLAGFANGYVHAKMKEIWRMVEFVYQDVDGTLYSTYRDSTLRKTAEWHEAGRGAELGKLPRGFVWSDCSKPFTPIQPEQRPAS